MAIPKKEDGDFVEGIYNWCDRWCERCHMTTHCRQYAMECIRDAFNADGSNDGDSAEFIEALMTSTAEFEDGGDLDEERYLEFEEPEFEEQEMDAFIEERNRIEKATANTHCVQLADRYIGLGSCWLEEWEILLDDNEPLEEAEEVISWYLFQLTVKLRRAIHGKLEGDEDFEDDIFGSAKVALIGADRSLAAWNTVREHLNTSQKASVDPIITLLKETIREIEVEIPEARLFKRPGLDT